MSDSDSQTELGATFRQKADIRGLEATIMKFAQDQLGFIADDDGFMGYSTWWGSERAGAFRYRGVCKGQKTMLKAQGVKPQTSEIDSLQGFAAANQSTLVRPPRLLAFERWDDSRGFEALAIEFIDSPKLISYPTTADEVAEFFKLFRDYRQHAIGQPWIKQPTEPLSLLVRKRTAEDLHMAGELFANQPLRQAEDFDLIEAGTALLERHYQKVKQQFQHCHISSDDVFKPQGSDQRYLYTSNFMWGWEAPYYDATYAYFHYNRLLCDRFEETDVSLLQSQAKLWQDALYKLADNDRERTLLALATLNKAIRRLAINDLAEKSTEPIRRQLIDQTRSDIRELMKQLS